MKWRLAVALVIGSAPAIAFGSTTILYLNFDGASLTEGADDDSTTNVSEIGGPTVPSYQPPAGALYTRQQGIDAVTDRVRGFFKPFNLQVVTARPSTGDYTMAMVGGSHSIIPGEDAAAGVSILDCDNSNPDGVVYDFAADLTPDYGGIPEIAIDAAHESGHSFGLEHTDNPDDIMYSVAMPTQMLTDIFATVFATGNYSAFNANGTTPMRCPSRGTVLDNVALLTAALGANPAPGDVTKPTLTWTFPLLPQVPPSFQVTFTASDDTQVERLELYKNFDLVAVMTQAPYQATVNAASGESFYLTVEAIDPAANRTTITQPFVADSATPPLCPDGTCASGAKCEDGICRLPLGTACTIQVQCYRDMCAQPVGASGSICTQGCSGVKPCPTGFACGSDELCAISTAPVLKSDGTACLAAGECTSGRCEGVCVPVCANGTGCDPGLSCVLVAGGEGCVVTPAPSPSPTGKSGGCDLAGSTGASPFASMLPFALALAFAIRRRFRSR